MTGIKGRVGKIFSHLLNLPFSVTGKLYLDLIIYTANEARFVRKIEENSHARQRGRRRKIVREIEISILGLQIVLD